MTDSCTRNFIHTIGIVKIEIEVDEVGVSLVGSEMSCWSLYTAISIYVVGSKPQACNTRPKGEYGILMTNYQQNQQCLVHTAKVSDGEPFG